jgi:hypothetical protein
MEHLSQAVSSFMDDNNRFSKTEMIGYIKQLPIIETSLPEAFRLAMGDKEKPCGFNHHAVSNDARCIVNDIFKDVSMRYSLQKSTGRVLTVEISYIEAGENGKGKFFLFWETLLRLCKEFGVHQISLCDRAKPGFWTHHGFNGDDGDMYRVLKLR